MRSAVRIAVGLRARIIGEPPADCKLHSLDFIDDYVGRAAATANGGDPAARL